MDEPITIRVNGIPAPKGSFRISRRKNGKGVTVRTDSNATDRWEAAVGWAAKEAMRGKPLLTCMLRMRVDFYLPRPQRPKGERPMVKPDIDKLLRSTFDAMEGIVYDNDSRVVSIEIGKWYASEGVGEGAWITVCEETAMMQRRGEIAGTEITLEDL